MATAIKVYFCPDDGHSCDAFNSNSSDLDVKGALLSQKEIFLDSPRVLCGDSSWWKMTRNPWWCGELFQKALPLQMIHLGQQTGVLKIVIFLPRHRDIVTIFTAPVAGCHASRQAV